MKDIVMGLTASAVLILCGALSWLFPFPFWYLWMALLIPVWLVLMPMCVGLMLFLIAISAGAWVRQKIQ